MSHRLLVVEVVADQGLRGEGRQEDREEEEGEGVIADESGHDDPRPQRCESPTIEKNTMPAAISTTQMTNIARTP
jgi:hypothetical protein